MQRKFTYTKKKMSNAMATVAYSAFLVRNLYTGANVCFSEHAYFKTEQAEF